MSKLKVPDLVKKLVNEGGKQLKDASVPTELLSFGKVTDATVESGSIRAVFGASVNAAIHIFNDANDSDTDGIIGALAGVTQSQKRTIDWRPQIALAANSTCIKYSLAADATAKATGKIGMAGGSISGDRSLRLLCYKRHNLTDTIANAVEADLDDISSPLLVADILKLGLHEATALKIRGALTASLTVSWSDIFSTSLNGLADLLGSADTGAFMINISAGASATFAAKLDDDFTLCFSREKTTGANAIRVALRKSTTRDSRFQAKAGIQVEFANPSAIQDVLSSVMSGVLGVPMAAIKAIEEAPSLKKVPDKYQPIVTALIDRFGIKEVDPLGPLLKRLKELTSLVSDRIEQTAKIKVALGFQYEYLRIASEASLLEITLSEAALRDLHGAILAFDFDKVLTYPRAKGMELDFFLHEKTVNRVRALGFSLGIGTWISIVSKQTRRDAFVSRRYLSSEGDLSTKAYLGSTQYNARVNTWSTEYGAMLKADLEEARSPQQTLGRDFKCGLHLWWEEGRIKPASELGRLVDDAVLWGVVAEEEAAALSARLQASLERAAECRVRLSVLLSDHGLRQAVRVIATASDKDWGRHAARALPWYSKQSARATCSSRETVYAPFFDAYSKAGNLTGNALKQLIAKSLRAYGGGLAGQEASGQTPWTLFQVLLRSDIENQRFWRRWHALREGTTRLIELLDVRGDWGDFDDDFKLMSSSFEQAFLLRAVASLLADRVPVAVDDGRAYAATLTVTYGPTDNQKAILIGGIA